MATNHGRFLTLLAPSLASLVVVSCGGSSGSSGVAELTADAQGLAGSIAAAGLGGTGGPATTTDRAADRSDELGDAVAEADLYRVRGDQLFLVNAWRGLAIVDLPQRAVVGRLALSGYPREMHLVGDRAIVVLERHDGSGALVELSIADPTAPALLSTHLLGGTPRATRRIGDRLISLALMPSGTAIESFRLVPALVPLDVESVDDRAERVHLTDHLAFLTTQSEGVSRIRIVDASDASGALTVRGAITVPGEVLDDEKLHFGAGHLRVVTRNWIGGLSSHLAIVDVADPDAPFVRGDLDLGEGEQLFATRFTEERVYIVTFEQIDPLWIIDLADPNAPTITAELLVPGFSLQLVAVDDRLVALGMAPTPEWQTSVSLFDVSDPFAPALSARLDLGLAASSAFGNPKAFGVFPEAGLVLLPLAGPTPNLAVIELGATTLTLRGGIETNLEPVRGFPHEEGLCALTDMRLVIADPANLASTEHVVIAEDILDGARVVPNGVGPGRIVRLAQDGVTAIVGGVELELWAETMHVHGGAAAVIGSDTLGRAGYVVDFSGQTPSVSPRIDLGYSGTTFLSTNTHGGGLIWFPGPNLRPADTFLTPSGRLVVRGTTGAPADLELGAGDLRDGFVVIDLSSGSVQARIDVLGTSITGAAIDGETLAVTLANGAGFDGQARPMLRHAYRAIDLAALTVTNETSVLGGVLALEGDLVFTLEEQWASGWSIVSSVVSSRLDVGVSRVIARRELPLGAYDLRIAGNTLYHSVGSAGPPITLGMPVAPPFFPPNDVYTVRLDERLGRGPTIDLGDEFVSMLLAEESGALVVRQGTIVERWNVAGNSAVREWSRDVGTFPRTARRDGASWFLALGLGGETRVP